MIPTPPDLLTPWRAVLRAELSVPVGPHRPAGHENKRPPYVRIACLGGPWRWRHLWYPRLIAESSAPTVLEARQLDAVVARVTAGWLGAEYPQTTTSGETLPAFFITDLSLASQGADLTVDGVPAVLTMADLCVQVTPLH